MEIPKKKIRPVRERMALGGNALFAQEEMRLDFTRLFYHFTESGLPARGQGGRRLSC